MVVHERGATSLWGVYDYRQVTVGYGEALGLGILIVKPCAVRISGRGPSVTR